VYVLGWRWWYQVHPFAPIEDNMATCKHCSKLFHACSSCGLQDYEWDFCDHVCKANYQKRFKDKVKAFWNSLSEEQQNAFDEIAEDDYLLESLVDGSFLD